MDSRGKQLEDHMRKLAGFVAVTSFVCALLFYGVAQAQYAEPIGSIQATASSTNTTIGSLITIRVTVRNGSGQLMGNVPVTATLITQPGSDADIGAATRVTDSQGNATYDLRVGSTPGVIVIQISTANGMSSTLVINVGGPSAITLIPQTAPLAVVQVPVPVPSSAVAGVLSGGGVVAGQPPAAPLDPLDAFISPPNTGDAGLATAQGDNSALTVATLALVVAGMLGLVGSSLALRSRRTDGR
jgi:hypothetical protein